MHQKLTLNTPIIIKANTQGFKLQKIYVQNKMDVQIKEVTVETESPATFLRHGSLACYVRWNNEEIIIDCNRILD